MSPRDARAGLGRPNRVAPDGSLHAVAARGTLMGNRGGRIHDPATGRVVRRQAGPAWIACRLAFKDRRRDVWGAGYTELFFLDEVTALAAGHRPCFECRRDDALAFARALGRALGIPALRAPAMDRMLAPDRAGGPSRPVGADPPEGAVGRTAQGFVARRGRRWLAWGHKGYGPEGAAPISMVTPAATLLALGAGYRPGWHASAVTGSSPPSRP